MTHNILYIVQFITQLLDNSIEHYYLMRYLTIIATGIKKKFRILFYKCLTLSAFAAQTQYTK